MAQLTTRRRRRHGVRHRFLKLRHDLRSGGRILAGAALAGLGTYGAVRTGGRLLKPLGRLTALRRYAPSLAGGIRRMATRRTAIDWALGTAAVTGIGQAKHEVETAARRRYRSFLRGR